MLDMIFYGRISRGKYWIAQISAVTLYASIGAIVIYTMIDTFHVSAHTLISFRAFFALFYLCVSTMFVTMRLRDIGKPVWHAFLLLVPVYNFYVMYCLLCKPSVSLVSELENDPAFD